MASSHLTGSAGKARGSYCGHSLHTARYEPIGSSYPKIKWPVSNPLSAEQIPEIEWFDGHVKRFIGALPPDGQAFDSQKLFFRLALDSATDFLFGESVYSLSSAASNQTGVAESSYEGRQGFAEAFDYAQYVLFQRTIALHLYWLINPSKFRRSNETVHRFVDYYVEKALRQTDQEKGDTQQRYCFLQALALHSKDAKVLRDQMVNVLLASRDDTASLLSSIFYFLARNQEVWDKLKAEVREASNASPVTLKKIQGLPYLRAIVSEGKLTLSSI
jgi:cytochrome P450